MEALSPTMEEGRLITWLKGEGDEVKEGDVLAEVETDKATMELVARGSGLLRKRLVGEGDTANVGTLIGVIAAEDEDIAELVAGAGGDGGAPASEEKADRAEDDAEKKDEAKKDEAKKDEAKKDDTKAPEAERREDAAPAGDKGDGRVKASPLARRLAEESGLELGGVRGSGPGGRIVKRDVEAAMEEGAPAAAPAAEREQAAPAPAAPEPVAGEAYRDVPLSQMRKTIARRLTQSIGPVPHFFLTVEIDMGEAMQLRKRINDRFRDEGIKVGPNDLVIKAVAMALRKHPWVNAAWTDQAIRQYDVVHIGVAVAVDEGLITPVIRDADRKGVTEIAQEVKELAGRAREKKLKPEEYTGSTFSISNLGMFGIEEFTAVINPPEAAILAVGAAQDRVVVENGEMVVRARMRVTLSCDHRVIDGATGAQFLQTLKRYLEEPMMMIA
jgi:pyruvate dehydrogenase E2 component (dihydrolipoamide acetyltransferase)